MSSLRLQTAPSPAIGTPGRHLSRTKATASTNRCRDLRRTLLAVAVSYLLWLPGITSAQDLGAGERSWNKCRACHQLGEAARNGVGPQLNGLFSRRAGSVAGYTYSTANKSSNIAWDDTTFADYIKDPRGKMPGTKMSFAGIKNEQEIKDLTAFLMQFAPDGKKSP